MAETEGGAAPVLSPDREGRSPSPVSGGPAAGQSEVMLRGGRPWGFTLQGGSEVVSPLTIAKIEAGGKADVDGRLQIGDEVLCINDVTATSHDEAVQLVCSAFRTLTLLVRRGAFDQTPSPRSVSLLRRAYEPKDPDTRAQDDSVVYSESKSARHGARLRPQRRGESFSIRSTSKRPTSWHPVDSSSIKTDPVAGLRSPQSPKSLNAEASKSKRSPKSPGALASSSSMQFGTPDSLSMASYSSFQSLQNLGAAKSTASMSPVGAAPGPHMSNSVSWHGHVSSAQSQPALNKPPMQPPPVEPRRKGHNSGGGGYGGPTSMPGGREHYGARSRAGTYTEGEDSNSAFMSYSQSHVQLNHNQSSANHSLPNPSVPTAHSLQDIRQRQGKDYALSGWSRPTPYKPNNYENIDAFEAAKSNAAACLSHSSLIQAQAYSHSYSNFAQSRSISDDGFNHGEEEPRSDPPEIPPWPQTDHRKMLSEDSGVELSMTSPPLPPGRDDSRGHLMLKPSRSQERLTSWPNYNQQGEEEDKGRTGPRAHSWASYQPRLNAHLEEKQDKRHTNTNYPQHAVIGNGDSSGAVHSAYGVDTKAEVELRNLYNAQPSYPGYGYEANYDVFHASQEPIQKETSAVDDLFQYANQSRDMSGKSTPTGHSVNPSPPPPLPQTAPPLPQTAPPLPQTTPPITQTAPPLPQTAPPPMPQKTRAGSSSGHTIIVRQKPFYNTGTQTEISPPPAAPSQYPQGASVPASRANQPQQAVQPEPMFRNVEIQVNMDLVMVTPMVTPMSTLDRRKHKKADQGCQVQPSMLPETLSSSLMNTGLVVQQPQDNYTDMNSFHRTAPIVDKMTQEKRIPETIREESPKKYENASTAQEMCNPTQEVKDTILQSIHDHSPSQTSIMRKLSREFFGNQMKPNYSSHPSLLTVPETQRRRSAEPPARPGEPSLLKQSKEYWSPPDADTNKAVTNKPPHCTEPAKDGEPQKEGKKKFDRSKKLSLRKAFGIFDEIESVDDPNSRRHLSSHGKSMSASQVGNLRNHHLYAEIKEGPPTEEKPLRWYNRPKGDEIYKDALHQRYDSGHFSQEENSNSSKIAQKVPFNNDNHVKKLHRTSSEQIRPVKERITERERSMEQAKSPERDIIRDKRHKLSDPTQRHKNSDPLELQGKSGNPGHRSSDPTMEEYNRKSTTTQHRLSDPASSQREKRLSGDSDLFRGSSYESSSLQRRSGSIRSTSSSSLDGHRMSDPELKKMQHLAVLNFFEMKTGKRLSSSSMDSSGNSKYNSLSSRGSSSIDSAVGLYRDRSPSPQKSPDEQAPFSQDHAFLLKKSKSLPRDMASHAEEGGMGLSLPPEPAPSIDSRPGSASSRDLTSTQKERRRSGSRWEYHKKEKSAPSQMESSQIVPVENGSTISGSTGPAGSTDQGHQAAPVQQASPATDSQLSPGAGTSPERVDTSEPLDCSLTLPKQTYEYSSSSSGSSSPTKSPATSEFGQKYAYQVTTNKAYTDNDGSPPPPVLPPRNYRPAPSAAPASAATGAEHKFRAPPPTPPQAQAAFQADTDFNTPQPDHYANQLRQQMRKQFSQSGVGATRLQSYGLTEVKPNVAMSRPVDRPPIPQEAVAPPQPVPRSKTLPELSIGADGFGYPDGTKSAREPRESTKMDMPIGNAPSLQHHNHLSQQHQSHHHHHQQQQQQQQQQKSLTQSHSQLHIQSQQQQQTQQQTQQHNHHPHNPAHRMQQSLSLTNIGSISSSFRAPDAAPVAAARDRDSLSRLPVSERPLPVSDQNRNSPKERHLSEAVPVSETTTTVLTPSGVDTDETQEKVPIPPSPPPQLPEEEGLRRRLSFEDEGDVSSQKYSNESYMTKRNNPRQGFNGNYRRSNSNEIPKPGAPSTPPALSATSAPQLLIASGAISSSGAPSSPPAITNPPRSETLVQVTSVMTVSKPLPSAENKTQLEAGPVLRTPTSGGTSGSSGLSHQYQPLSVYNNNTPPPVPPKHGRAAPVLPQPPPPLISPGSELVEEAMTSSSMSALESTPPEFVFSSRPGVTNLDEASSLLSAMRSGGAGSPSGASIVSSNSSSSSSSGLAGRTSKVTTPTTTSGNTESSLSTSRERLTEAVITHNGHDVPSPDSTCRPTPRSRQSKKTDSPPTLPSCPPPDHTYTYQASSSKETDSREDKEQDSSPTPQGDDEPGGAPEGEEKGEGLSPGLSPLHVRQKSMEEIECEKVAAVVAIQIVDDDKQLSDVILPPPEHKMTTDYMSGLFDVADMPAVPTMVANRSPRSQRDENKENRRSLETSPPPADSVYWSPPSVASLQNKMREEGIQREEILREMSREIGVPDTSLQRQKEELEARIKQKLDILRNEKDALGEEISDNEQLGKEVTGVVEKKVKNKGEFDKYKLYVDELDKVMYLLLKLSGRLARAENAVMSLPPDADEKDKMLLTMKRDEASEKHADAKLLKQGIDRRSQQVSGFLHRYLTGEEYDTYQYYIKMKSKLTMEQQEIDDKIKLGEEQLRALKRSMQR